MPASNNPKKYMHFYWIAFLAFIVLVIFFVKGLGLNPAFLPSKLINEPFPEFTLRTIGEPSSLKNKQDILGEPVLVHVWATWCGICLREHDDLLAIKQVWPYKIIGVNYKDEPAQVAKWLSQKGSPYDFSLDDRTGKLGIDLGVYGTPETYVVNEQGIIIARHVGPISKEVVERSVLPMLERQ